MGAPKQKWSAQEESALKAGVIKHGAGKWRTILIDPEFSNILCLRSNVDLKDKWRNLSAIANGWGSREKARIGLRRSQHAIQHDDNPMALSTVKDLDDEIVDAEPVAMSSGNSHITSFKRLDNHILEAITSLKEPFGSEKMAIATYIEDQYESLNLKQLSVKLKAMTLSGKLVKVNQRYRLSPYVAFSERRSSKLSLSEERQREVSKVEKDDLKPLKSQNDAGLSRIRNMTRQEAAAIAAQRVAAAEAALAEAEEAAREADAAEADAEAAQAFADAAMLTLERRNAAKLMD